MVNTSSNFAAITGRGKMKKVKSAKKMPPFIKAKGKGKPKPDDMALLEKTKMSV
jgi:hypothetical protein